MNRPVLVVLALVAATTLLDAMPDRSDATTIGQMLESQCPQGSTIKGLQAQSREDAALMEGDLETSDKELARLFYRCSVGTSNAYVRDWARFFYASNLAISEKDTLRNLRAMFLAIVTVNNLAAETQYSDVRVAALSSRKRFKATYVSLYEAKFGSPPPDVAEEAQSDKESLPPHEEQVQVATHLDQALPAPAFDAASFYKYNCASCHGATGRGDSGGPSLMTVTQDDVESSLIDPQGTMPLFVPSVITSEDGEAVARYITESLQVK